ncbi:MAG: hypothetical protein DMF37_12525 [Verrucomicrobia bacterium]|nr:MAG: hypothetical protein DMF37_12525 [Verrucomicrobiota bacterium]
MVNSGSAGADGCSMSAPIGALSAEFRTTRCPFSATCLSKTASLIPPPRFVRRSSTSELRSVSIFSGKLGTGSAAFGATSGAASGVEEAIVAVGEACPGVTLTGADLGGACFTR